MSVVLQETHRIKAGSDFDGTAPVVETEDLISGDLIYAPATAGGLFVCPMNRTDKRPRVVDDPVEKGQARRVQNIRVIFGLQTSWSLSIVNCKDHELLLINGTTETDMVITDTFDLAPDDKLKLVTTGASAAMVATITYSMKVDI